MENKEDLINEMRRAVRILQRQEAVLGVHCPPHITIQREDLEKKIAELSQLSVLDEHYETKREDIFSDITSIGNDLGFTVEIRTEDIDYAITINLLFIKYHRRISQRRIMILLGIMVSLCASIFMVERAAGGEGPIHNVASTVVARAGIAMGVPALSPTPIILVVTQTSMPSAIPASTLEPTSIWLGSTGLPTPLTIASTSTSIVMVTTTTTPTLTMPSSITLSPTITFTVAPSITFTLTPTLTFTVTPDVITSTLTSTQTPTSTLDVIPTASLTGTQPTVSTTVETPVLTNTEIGTLPTPETPTINDTTVATPTSAGVDVQVPTDTPLPIPVVEETSTPVGEPLLEKQQSSDR